MYLEFYGLEQAPFSITPDPHYVFLSEHHRDALAHLLYGIQQGGGGGFVQLTGEVGTGKTTLSRLLLNQLPEDTQAALVLNPRLDPVELLQTICEELRLDVPAAKSTDSDADAPRGGKAYYDALSAHLLDAYAKGQRVVLIIDEAQNLSPAALEQVRLLTNLETETQKLLQIILIGQPELRDMLARPDLRQLAQRITARYHLQPLGESATGAYLRHRLTTAGAKRFPFSTDAVRRLHRHSGGVPRLINVIAERAMLGGYAQDLLVIDAKTVDRAAKEALAPAAEPAGTTSMRRPLIALAALAALAMLGTLLLSRNARHDEPAPAPQPTAAMSTPAVAAPVAPTAAPPPSPANGSNAAHDLGALLQAMHGGSRGTTQAWLGLNTRWKTPAGMRRASPDACLTSPMPGWYCLRSRASIDQLAHIDRAVMLHLRMEPDVAWALLQGIDAQRVRVAIDGTSYDIDRVALGSVWNGEYLAIWPAPDALSARYAAGEPQARAWVSQRLRDSGISAGDPVTGLREFRMRHGLPESATLDGDTLFVLSTRLQGPRLGAITP